MLRMPACCWSCTTRCGASADVQRHRACLRTRSTVSTANRASSWPRHTKAPRRQRPGGTAAARRVALSGRRHAAARRRPALHAAVERCRRHAAVIRARSLSTACHDRCVHDVTRAQLPTRRRRHGRSSVSTACDEHRTKSTLPPALRRRWRATSAAVAAAVATYVCQTAWLEEEARPRRTSAAQRLSFAELRRLPTPAAGPRRPRACDTHRPTSSKVGRRTHLAANFCELRAPRRLHGAGDCMAPHRRHATLPASVSAALPVCQPALCVQFSLASHPPFEVGKPHATLTSQQCHLHDARAEVARHTSPRQDGVGSRSCAGGLVARNRGTNWLGRRAGRGARGSAGAAGRACRRRRHRRRRVPRPRRGRAPPLLTMTRTRLRPPQRPAAPPRSWSSRRPRRSASRPRCWRCVCRLGVLACRVQSQVVRLRVRECGGGRSRAGHRSLKHDDDGSGRALTALFAHPPARPAPRSCPDLAAARRAARRRHARRKRACGAGHAIVRSNIAPDCRESRIHAPRPPPAPTEAPLLCASFPRPSASPQPLLAGLDLGSLSFFSLATS